MTKMINKICEGEDCNEDISHRWKGTRFCLGCSRKRTMESAGRLRRRKKKEGK